MIPRAGMAGNDQPTEKRDARMRTDKTKMRAGCTATTLGDHYPKLRRHWFNAISKLGLELGDSFDLDFHTILFHGEDALLRKARTRR